ncbi:PilZ domain-containing protein [Bdellovibrio bacteriovorus]
MESKSSTLERPRAVQMAAAVLIATPLLDIMMMQRTGTQIFSWISWVMIAGAGISLMIRHKLSWLVGITLCILFVVSTGVSLFQEIESADPIVSSAKLLDCLLVLFIVGTVSYFFRYPYLDRRQNWFAPTGERFALSMSVVLDGMETQTLDLSYTGAKISAPEGKLFKVGDKVPLQFSEINDIQCWARIIDSKPGQVRVHFEDTSAGDKEMIRQWLSAQNLQKV